MSQRLQSPHALEDPLNSLWLKCFILHDEFMSSPLSVPSEPCTPLCRQICPSQITSFMNETAVRAKQVLKTLPFYNILNKEPVYVKRPQDFNLFSTPLASSHTQLNLKLSYLPLPRSSSGPLSTAQVIKEFAPKAPIPGSSSYKNSQKTRMGFLKATGGEWVTMQETGQQNRKLVHFMGL